MEIPKHLLPLYKGWMAFSHALGLVMSKILLTILWIVGFGIYAIPMKIATIFRPKKSLATYWHDVPAEYPDSMRHQF